MTMKRIFFTAFLALLSTFAVIFPLRAEDNPILDKFAMRLDAVERKFWRIALLAPDHRDRSKFSSELHELESLARQVGFSCTSYKEKKRPDLYADCLLITRAYDQFSINSQIKNRKVTLSGTSLKDYRRRHNKLMREKADEEQESGKGKRRKSQSTPKHSQVDPDDYSDFLDEVSDKNSRKFSSWTNNIKSKEKAKSAEQIFSVWQKSICSLRANIVQLAQKGTFKKEKKVHGGSNNRR